MRQLLSGEKPSCPGVQLRKILLDCFSTTVTSDTVLGSTTETKNSHAHPYATQLKCQTDLVLPLMLILASLEVETPFKLWASQLKRLYLLTPASGQNSVAAQSVLKVKSGGMHVRQNFHVVRLSREVTNTKTMFRDESLFFIPHRQVHAD